MDNTIVTEEDKQEFLSRLQVTDQAIHNILNSEQRSIEWKQFREDRLTGSNFGAAAGMSKYMSPLQLVASQLWQEFKGNANTEKGTTIESWAFALTEAYFKENFEKMGSEKVFMKDTGLLISKEHPWLGISSDGLLHLVKDGVEEIVTIEFKAPAKDRFYPEGVPQHYLCQVVGAMVLLK